jgi:isoamylase
MALNGEAIEDVDVRGDRITGASFLLLFNAGEQPVSFLLPPPAEGWTWTRVLDTASDDPPADARHEGDTYPLLDRSMAVLRMDKP